VIIDELLLLKHKLRNNLAGRRIQHYSQNIFFGKLVQYTNQYPSILGDDYLITLKTTERLYHWLVVH